MGNHAALIRQENAGLPVAQRGRYFLEFDLGGGRKRHVAAIEPLHTRATQAEIDTTWVASTDPAWQWQLAQTDFQAHARDPFNSGDLIRWTHESGEWVIVDPQSINWVNQDNSRQQIAIKQAVSGVSDDFTLRFPDAYGAGRHFEYIAHPKRLVKHFILDGPLPDPESWLTGTIWFEIEWTLRSSAGVELYLDGVLWSGTDTVRTSDRIEFKASADAEPLWYAEVPTATDADGEVVRAEYEVREQGGNYFITVRVARDWLLSAAYPVRADPTFTDGYGGDVQTYKDTYLRSDEPDLNYGTDSLLIVKDDGRHPLIEFDLSSIPADAVCDSATLYLYKGAAHGVSTTMYVHELLSGNADWTELGATWNTKNGVDSWAGSAGANTAGTDYNGTAIGSWLVNIGDEDGTEYSTTLPVAVVEGWFGASNSNYGMQIRYVDWTYGRLKSSDSSETGYRPKLVVEYTEAAVEALSVGVTSDAAAYQVNAPLIVG